MKLLPVVGLLILTGCIRGNVKEECFIRPLSQYPVSSEKRSYTAYETALLVGSRRCESGERSQVITFLCRNDGGTWGRVIAVRKIGDLERVYFYFDGSGDKLSAIELFDISRPTKRVWYGFSPSTCVDWKVLETMCYGTSPSWDIYSDEER